MPNNLEERPYKLYRAGPKGLKSFLRGEEETGLPDPSAPDRKRRDPGRKRRLFRGPWTVGRVIKYVLVAIASWLLLSLVLFMLSAQIETGNLPSSASDALTSGGNMLFSADNVLILGTDQRPTGSKEPGANTHDAGSRTDTIMLWRIGGGDLAAAVDPARHGGGHPGPRHQQDQCGLRDRGASAARSRPSRRSRGSRSTT